jgi:hypothetical protein
MAMFGFHRETTMPKFSKTVNHAIAAGHQRCCLGLKQGISLVSVIAFKMNKRICLRLFLASRLSSRQPALLHGDSAAGAEVSALPSFSEPHVYGCVLPCRFSLRALRVLRGENWVALLNFAPAKGRLNPAVP